MSYGCKIIVRSDARNIIMKNVLNWKDISICRQSEAKGIIYRYKNSLIWTGVKCINPVVLWLIGCCVMTNCFDQLVTNSIVMNCFPWLKIKTNWGNRAKWGKREMRFGKNDWWLNSRMNSSAKTVPIAMATAAYSFFCKTSSSMVGQLSNKHSNWTVHTNW